MNRSWCLLALAAFAAASVRSSLPAADAAEGSIPLRADDAIGGTLVRCGDRHAFETELLRGETIRVRVALVDPTVPPELRLTAPSGADLSKTARIRASGGTLTAGPFRAPESGVFRLTLTSYAVHELRYEMTTSVGRRARRTVRLAANGRTSQVLAAAGSTFSVIARHGATPRIVATFPGEGPRTIVPGDPLFAALTGTGVAAPRSGSYAFSVTGAAARLVVTPPSDVAETTLAFPELPDGDAALAWYPSTGWVASPVTARAEPDAPPPAPVDPLTLLTAHPALRPDAVAFADTSVVLGAPAGVGMPLSGAPSLAEIVASALAADTPTGRSYTLTAARAGLGDVTYRVSFTVDGRPAAAPMTLDGRVTMRWSVASGAPSHAGSWSLSFDPVRGVQILDGAESLTDGAARTVSSAARGFALPLAPGTRASGALTTSVADAASGTSVVRRETYDGAGTVRVEAGPSLGGAASANVTLK